MKTKKLFVLVLSSLLVVLGLTGCSQKLLNTKSLQNVTIEKTFNNETSTFKRDGNNYALIVGDSTETFTKYENVVFKYYTTTTTEEVEEEVPGDEDNKTTAPVTTTQAPQTTTTAPSTTTEPVATTPNQTTTAPSTTVVVTSAPTNSARPSTSQATTTKYVTKTVFHSEVSNDETYKYFTLLENLEKGGLDELKANEVISQYLTGVKIEPQTDAKEAYDRGYLTVSNVNLEVVSKKVSKFTITFEYASKSYSVVYSFKDYGTTKIEMPKESAEDKGYASSLSKNNAVVTLKFKGYGTVKIQLFEDIDDENVVNYFLYLLKKKFYKKATVNAQPTMANGIAFGESAETISKTVDVDSKFTYSNTRGTLTMLVSESSKATSKLIINTSKNTTYDSNAYTPIGGVVEGFEVLDALMGLTAEDFANVSVTISVKYNKHKYSEPDFS